MKEKGVLGTSIHLSHRQGRGAYAELRGSNCRPTTETPPARSTGSRPPPRASAETGKVLEIHGHVDNEGGTPLSVGDKGHGCVFAVSSSRACGAQRNKRRTHSSLEVSSPSAGAPWANRSPPPPPARWYPIPAGSTNPRKTRANPSEELFQTRDRAEARGFVVPVPALCTDE